MRTPSTVRYFRAWRTLLFTMALSFGSARAEVPEPAQPRTEEASDAARAAFLEGVAAVKESQWATALDHFERSQTKRKHPVTSYNIGLCQRAVGHYALAQRAFEDALAQNTTGGGTLLTPALAEETRTLLREVERALAHVDITMAPADAEIRIDERPLTRDGNAYVAGISANESAARVSPEFQSGGRAVFSVSVDPGAHTLRISRRGFAEEVRALDLPQGGVLAVVVTLRELPGSLRVSATPTATVYLAGEKLGPSPLVAERPKGDYLVTLKRDGYVPFSSRVYFAPDEHRDLVATLLRESTPITKRWWFYAILGGAAAALAVTTYAIVRSTEQPKSDGGSLGWVVSPP